MADPTLILAGIQAGIKYYNATRQDYISAVADQDLLLPSLPVEGLNAADVMDWFKHDDIGMACAEENIRIQFIVNRANPTQKQKDELIGYYRFYFFRENPDLANHDLNWTKATASDMNSVALQQIRQYGDQSLTGKQTPLQRIAGNLINVAVDYFADTPGAINESKSYGRVLKSFLQGINDVDFKDTPVEQLADRMMLGVLDSVAAHPDVFGGSPKERLLIQNTTRQIATTANKHLKDASRLEIRNQANWVQMITQSMLSGAAETVLSEPGLFFESNSQAENELVAEVGTALTEMVLTEEGPNFKALFTSAGLDKVAKAALAAAARNPSLIRIGNQGIQTILVSLANDLSKLNGPIHADLFPEMAQLVLEYSAQNIETLWDVDADEPKHLLVTATQSMLSQLAKQPPSAKWKPNFTPDALSQTLETVLQEVIDNPHWVLTSDDQDKSNLDLAMEAIMKSLRKMPGHRINSATGLAILEIGLTAVATQPKYLQKVSGSNSAKLAITAALDGLITEVFTQASTEAQWTVARNSSFQWIIEITLNTLAERGLTADHIKAARNTIKKLEDGIQLEDFESLLIEKIDELTA